MIKKIVATVLCLAVFSPIVLFAEDVFVTKQGTKYHSENCALIAKKDKSPMSLGDAQSSGLTACAKCIGKDSTKKEIKEGLVLITENGEKYHKPQCNLIKSRKTTSVSLEEASAKNLEPCRRCFPELAKKEE